MSGESLYSQLTRTDKNGTVVGIRLDRLATLSAGILATAFGSGVASLVSSVIDTFLITPLDGLASWIDTLTSTGTTGIRAIGYGVWSPLIELLRAFGPFAWIVAVVAVIAIAYGVHKGWSLRG